MQTKNSFTRPAWGFRAAYFNYWQFVNTRRAREYLRNKPEEAK